jgi:hypothetical protein
MSSRFLVVLAIAACASPREDVIAFEPDGPWAAETFWDMPFPSDLRLTEDGRPRIEGFPNPRNQPIVSDLVSVADQRRGWPVMPTVWFRLREPTAIDASGAMLIDLEMRSTVPIEVEQIADDPFAKGLVAIAPRAGIVLRGDATYAVVLTKAFADLDRPGAYDELRGGGGSAGAKRVYAPLWPALKEMGITDDVVATVFTTGDEVVELRRRSNALTEIVRLEDVTVGPSHADYCELRGTAVMPQYQVGTPPFDREGRFVLDDDGIPMRQGETRVPFVVTVPNGTMPASGWPLWQFFHGSGGASFDLVDDGPVLTPEGEPQAGEGVGAVVARRGIAAVAAALPLNPERVAGVGNYAYLNLNNLGAFPYTFQQGVFEQRMFLDALLATTLPGCGGVKFDPAKLVAGGHSMGGMYTNMIAAIEPRYGAITPFGAGGFWNRMILETEIFPGARELLAGILGVDELTPAHPVLGLMTLGWEIAEPGASMARIARRPLPGMTAKYVYQPIGMDDQFFASSIFDAAALAYGNRQAGELVWPGTQDALHADGLDGMMQYPVKGTNTVVQYTDGGILDAHYIYRQREEVRYQYGCFLATFLRDGVPTVAAPAPVASPCPL